MTTITCNKCGNEIEINEALESQARKLIEEEVKAKSKKEIEQVQKEAELKAEKRISEKFELESKQRTAEMEENRKQNRDLRDQLLELTKQLQQQKIKEQNLEIEMRKKFLEEQDKIYAEAKTKASEEHKLTIAELTKQIQDFKKANEDLNKKLEQRSQQLQGEVQELDLENSLRQSFIYDTIEPVGKGVRGADVRQIVKTQLGNICGVILWESKQTKAWSNEWIQKLKTDLRAEKANIPMIVTPQLPDEAKAGFGFKEGVYIVSPQLILPIAEAMRQKLIEIAREKFVAQNRDDKADSLYVYVTGTEFRQQLEAIAEVFMDMNTQILKEKVAFEKIWKTREAQITKLFSSTTRIIGSMRGIIGQSLPMVKGFELPEGDTEVGDSLSGKLFP